MTPPHTGGPLVIGGVGGSGTRVVAEIAGAVGLFLGPDLNDASDNLWFHFLLRRPSWYDAQVAGDRSGVRLGLRILEEAMHGRLVQDAEVRHFVAAARRDAVADGVGRLWARKRQITLRRQGVSGRDHPSWGWKEPNSHVYLPDLVAHFGDRLRYVHVMRHGLDMAYSTNQRQLLNWRHLYGLAGDAAADTSMALEYWIRANRRAIDFGREHIGDRFLLVNFDELCRNPHDGVAALLAFCGVDPEQALVTALAKSPRPPESTGRWRQHGLQSFSTDQLEQVAALGFPVGDATQS